jgi:hypothetical protein
LTVNSLLDRAEQAVRRGELWRAKEILQGGIRSGGYDPVLFERLGLVLMRMGDILEAGKYLFLSGRRDSSYEGPITLYLNRFARKEPLHLYHTFPRAARLERREDYPASVASELARLGLPEKLPAPRKSRTATSTGFGAQMMGFGCAAIVALVLGLVVIGILRIVEWVRG